MFTKSNCTSGIGGLLIPLAGNSCFHAELMKMGLPTTQTTKQTRMVSKHLSDHLISTKDKASRLKYTNYNQIKKRKMELNPSQTCR